MFSKKSARRLPSGPWDSEPDHEQWRCDITGYHCEVTRHRVFGNWCGYVHLEPGHPYYGEPVCSELLMNIDVHGGITYAISGQTILRKLTFQPPVWVLGFDCAGWGDLIPFFGNDPINDQTSYKDLGFVKFETRRLAYQLMLIERGKYNELC